MNDRIKELEKQMYDLSQELIAEREKAVPQPVENFHFETAEGPVSLSSLFGDKKELIVIHNMGKTCNYCSLWAETLQSTIPFVETRAAYVLVNPNSPAEQKEFAASRGWKFPMVTDATGEFTKAMGYLTDDGHWGPGCSAFVRNDDGSISRTGTTEFGPGDAFAPIWHFWSLLPGHYESWEPPIPTK